MADDFDINDYTEYDGDGPYFDPYAGCYDDDPNDLWGEEDDHEYWLSECGLVAGQGCLIFEPKLWRWHWPKCSKGEREIIWVFPTMSVMWWRR